MDTASHIIACAELVFDAHGFAATGMDRLTAAAQVSTRTLYKHLGGKTALICAVLAARRHRFFARLQGDSLDALFDGLDAWMRVEGARGCFFLRAQGEMGDAPAVAEEVATYRRQLRDLIAGAVAAEVGERPEAPLVDAVLLLFEGATSMASYRGPAAFDTARAAAKLLIARTDRHPSQRR